MVVAQVVAVATQKSGVVDRALGLVPQRLERTAQVAIAAGKHDGEMELAMRL